MRSSRVTRSIEELAGKHSLGKLPINVRKIAMEYAHVNTDPLPDDISGMLVPAPHTTKKWIIVVNKKHSPERQRFSMAHELGHLLLHDFKAAHADGTMAIRYRNAVSATGTDRDEIEANQFAAELLLPASLLIPRLNELNLDWEEPQRQPAFEDLAAECKVSEQALLLRIGGLLQR